MPGPSGKPPRYQMHLHNLRAMQQVGYAESEPRPYGPRHDERWESDIQILWVKGADGRVVTGFWPVYAGDGKSKQQARDAAAKAALEAIGIDVQTLP
ncbi:hypothetical protein FRB90_002485 [Tulasnella sp. 427]|nr:hypothetical protein FRB90_002485 [Tulasnella sp. 427]